MIIGIGGSSNAGKSNLAALIAEACSPRKVAIFSQDDYVYPEQALPRIRDHIDWEHPDTIDFDRFRSDLESAAHENDLVIAEGLFLFCRPELNKVFDKMIYVGLQKETFHKRKSADLRWGREPEWYIDHIWSRHKQYGKPPDGNDLLMLQGEEEWPLDRILAFLNI